MWRRMQGKVSNQKLHNNLTLSVGILKLTFPISYAILISCVQEGTYLRPCFSLHMKGNMILDKGRWLDVVYSLIWGQ